MVDRNGRAGFHERRDADRALSASPEIFGAPTQYKFENFFHPFVGEMIEQLNRRSIKGLLDPEFHKGLRASGRFFDDFYTPADGVTVTSFNKDIDLRVGGPYANYNWELLFHVPLGVAVHLSNNQRFAEAQRWFHYIFDPTSNDTTVSGPARYWKFLLFREEEDVHNIVELLHLLSKTTLTQAEADLKKALLSGYQAIQDNPFQPHRVAATRPIAYQLHVVMKYVDNLIAWGDSLFREDTAESINEATQRYVLASNILGPRPQDLPPAGKPRVQSFNQLKGKLDDLGNALVKLETQFPFNLAAGPTGSSDDGSDAAIAGIGRSLYFCIPRNDRLLTYWDRVADRLFKVRNCMNLEGVVRQLALFEPAIDPGLLVKAAAAGVETGALTAGLFQPVGQLRGGVLLQQALDVCNDVRGLGNALLAAIEKGDAEAVGLLRQGHEIQVHTREQDIRYLQWRTAQASTDALVRSREMSLERHRHYLRLLGMGPSGAPSIGGDPAAVIVGHAQNPDDKPLLTEVGFDAAYQALVGQYDRPFLVQPLPKLKLAGDASPSSDAGDTSSGRLKLIAKEDQELNKNLPTARDLNVASSVLDTVASVVTMIPDLNVDLHFWGLGLHSKVFGGVKLSEVSKIAAGIVRTKAAWEQDQAGMASRTASYERRAEDWVLQGNLAAHELMHIGRQILGSVIAEQAAQREYQNTKAQAAAASEVDRMLRSKYTNQELYGWLQGELTRLYFDYYRFALDVARKAELTIKRELMQPELDSTQFVKSDYWSAGRKGLLAADALAIDLRRLQSAYQENRRREYELVRHVSIAQMDPLALVQLRETGVCEVSIPESLFDLGCPGHYLRRIKRVSVSIPAVTGPYTSVNCTLSLLRSSVRTKPTGAGYPRRDGVDERFDDYMGTIQSIVTSTGRDDDGLFDSSAADDRLLPFEGAGVISTWRIELAHEFPQFDFDTISDVVLHIQYTARDGGAVLRKAAVGHLSRLVAEAKGTGCARLFDVAQEFPSDWARFAASEPGGRAQLKVSLREEHYPFWSAGRTRETTQVTLLARGPADADTIKVFGGPETAKSDALSRDDGMGGLFWGKLEKIALPDPVGDLSLHFEPGTVEDLWVILTWSAAAIDD